LDYCCTHIHSWEDCPLTREKHSLLTTDISLLGYIQFLLVNGQETCDRCLLSS
jgi:hypothetical protein